MQNLRQLFPFGSFFASFASTAFRMQSSARCDKPLLLELVALSVSVANHAGSIIRQIMHEGSLEIVEKGFKDIQTKADRDAQNFIVNSLYQHFSAAKFKVIGEEDLSCETDKSAAHLKEIKLCDKVLSHKLPKELSDVDESDIVVWVDPLDGTTEFAQSKENPELREHVTVLIGIAVSGEAVAGVIHQPYWNRDSSKSPGRTVWGVRGMGAFGIEPSMPSANQRIIATTRSHMTDEVEAAIASMQPTEILRVGGAGHKVLLLIDGVAHAYVFASSGCKKWDTCAPEAVLVAHGGTLSDIHGNRLHYDASVKRLNSAGVLATASGQDHHWYISQIPNAVKDKLIP